jgi:hypothetical protein
MVGFRKVLAYTRKKGLVDDHPFLLAASALRITKGDWAKAYTRLREQANHFALSGDIETAELITFSARVVKFYGRGY